ncbi:MAG: hypothetical protein P9X22_05745 [Candidatus Zapsychrus exili]|nr:hypothetical protein [Candidatus Zapsychrus exili]
MSKSKKKDKFNIIFEKLSQLKDSKEVAVFEGLEEFEEINELRKIVLDVSEEEQSFTTAV